MRRREQGKALGNFNQLAAMNDIGAPEPLLSRDQVFFEPQTLGQIGGGRLFSQEGVGAQLDRESVAPDGLERSARAIAAFENSDLDRHFASGREFADAMSGGKSGDSCADDCNSLHVTNSAISEGPLWLQPGIFLYPLFCGKRADWTENRYYRPKQRPPDHSRAESRRADLPADPAYPRGSPRKKEENARGARSGRQKPEIYAWARAPPLVDNFGAFARTSCWLISDVQRSG